MAKFGHVCTFFMALIVVEAAVLTGKAFYCRDPDTGKLYAVNSTWSSTTFCGNYTCKLRKRNITETQYTPIRQLNITNINTTTSLNHTNNEHNITVTIEERTEPEIEAVIHKDKDNEITELNRQIDNILPDKQTEVSINTEKPNDDNRYLTENEIKSISEVLQTVKKSDLNAIVDIYNLAQDIYKEMDLVADKEISDEIINEIADEKFLKKPRKKYWYDTVANKGRVDMNYKGSNQVTSTVLPKVLPNQEMPSYFNGALNREDFGTLPYYYPISHFQRSSSYVHKPTVPSKLVKPKHKPCQANKLIKDMQVAQNEVKPSYLLPYPFAYVHPYNYSDLSKNFYSNNNLYWNYYNQQRQQQPYYNTFIAQVPNFIPRAVLVNPQLHDEVTAIEQKPVENKLEKLVLNNKENDVTDWKTGELSREFLDEARAHIDTSKLLKAFPFKKHVKLEKVGKLIKLDELSRSRRSADEQIAENKEGTDNPYVEEHYETYLERTICPTQSDPGFFRYGNLSQPFPECCPQLINVTSKPQ